MIVDPNTDTESSRTHTQMIIDPVPDTNLDTGAIVSASVASV